MDNLNLLKYFVKEPERKFYVRELAKLTKKSPTTISKHLSTFRSKNLLISRREYNHLLFKANTENPLFKTIKLYYNLRNLREIGLIDYLNKEFNHPEAIILFGSFARAEDIPKSDIDILIITQIKRHINLSTFEKKLEHKIQLFLYSKKEINKMKFKNKELINNFVNGIILEGYWELL